MTTEQLNEFYMLAMTRNYSDTAEKLYISQSALSRHIQSMEEELGVCLFSRTTREVKLTNEGKVFLSRVPLLLKKAVSIESLANLTAINTSGTVKVLYASQTLNSRIIQFLHNFKDSYQDIRLETVPLCSHSAIDPIYDADIMISPCDFTGTKPDDILGGLATTQSALLAIPPYHHFGEASSISLSDLRGETLLLPFPDVLEGPYAQLALIATHKCYGHLPKITASTEEQAILHVELGDGVMILPHHLKHHVHMRTRTIPISDPECFFPIYVYYNAGGANGAAALFFQSITEFFQKK